MAADVSESRRAYTVRLELVDEPGELLRALRPIADNGGNLLSIFHERGNLTPRGNIPVEVDMECVPGRFEDVVEGLREAGVTVIQAGEERFSEQLSVLLVGHIVETDLSDTLSVIEDCSGASVTDFALDAPAGTDDVSSARVQLAVEPGRTESALDVVREVADRKDLQLVEPLVEGDA
ncbi:amino acid-binding protein [Haloarchaeobius sp. TZWWS8]|uniref:amino acid-binding protein n=1 Tax=Haloarchaeobius sp. TZWWS8 TaxID=3446121 RepID=UPI003EC08A25